MREKKAISTKISTSVSSLMSNATGYARYYLSSKFPPNFFKKTFITDSLSEIQMEDSDDVQKFAKPLLIITPKYTGELNGFDWRAVQQITAKSNKMMNRVLHDSENDIRIYSIPDRIRIGFDVKIKLQSQMHAYNVLHYVKQAFEFNGYNYLNNIKLETELPRPYVRYIANKLGLDLTTSDGREKMDEYLLDHSYNSISEKIGLASGVSQYSYNYNTNILANFLDEPISDKNVNNLVIDNTTVSFSFNFDFWSHSNYVLEVMDEEIDPQSFLEASDEIGAMKYDFYVPTHFITEQYNNMHLIVRKPFLPDINTEVDILEFKPIINSELQMVIETAIKYKLDMSKIIKARVLINNQEYDTDLFSVDWKAYNLITQHPMSNVTYTLMIYGDLKVLNQISSLVASGKESEVAKLKL